MKKFPQLLSEKNILSHLQISVQIVDYNADYPFVMKEVCIKVNQVLLEIQ